MDFFDDKDELVVWELAHPDGSSIFIKHSITGSEVAYIFGPFLFTTQKELIRQEGTTGPRNLLRALVDGTIGQQVSLEWVLEHARTGFDPLGTDCIVLGDMLIPCSKNGAVLADASLNHDLNSPDEDWITPWTNMVDHWGVPAMRIINANLINQMVTPGLIH